MTFILMTSVDYIFIMYHILWDLLDIFLTRELQPQQWRLADFRLQPGFIYTASINTLKVEKDLERKQKIESGRQGRQKHVSGERTEK